LIELPKYLGASNIPGLLHICDSIVSCTDDVIKCNARRLEFIDPVSLTSLAATCHTISLREQKVQLLNLNESMQSYLARMDLFHSCHIEDKDKRARRDRSDSLVEIMHINNIDQADHVAPLLAKAVIGQMPDITLDGEPDEMTGYKPYELITTPLEYIFAELLDNALTHGRHHGHKSSSVWVAAQYYPKKQLIRMGVVDNGCGYYASLAGNPDLIEDSHAGAIETALLPRVSCNKDVGLMAATHNQGIGLSVVNQLVASAGGSLNLTSGDASIEVSVGKLGRTKTVSSWSGVNLALEIPRGKIRLVKIQEVIGKFRGADDGIEILFQ